MDPVVTEKTNFVYTSSVDDVGDLPGERLPAGTFRSVWKPTEDERARIFGGDNISITLWAEPIPPLEVGITAELVK